MLDYKIILIRRYKGEWSLNGDTYEGLIWLSDSPKPTKKELDDQWEDVQAEIIAEENAKIAAKEALLQKLGITQEEANLLLN